MSAPFGGINWPVVQLALQRWVTASSGLPSGSVYWGQQDALKIPEPAIEMRIYTQLQVGPPWLDRESNVLSVSQKTVTNVDPDLDTVASPAHGLVTGDGPLRLHTTGTLPGNVPADFWAVVVDSGTFKIARTFFDTGGNFPGNPVTTVDVTDAGAGTLTFSGDSRTRRAGQEMLYVARAVERSTLNLTCFTSAAVGMDMAVAVLHNIAARRPFPPLQAILQAANIGVEHVEHVRAVHGMRNAVMFEPRAIMQVHLSVPSETSMTGTIIQRVKGTNLVTGKTFQVP